MSLLERFMGGGREQRLLLVCPSNFHMLRAYEACRGEGIEAELMPTPRGIGSACTTVIAFPAAQEARVKALLHRRSLQWEGIYPLVRPRRKLDWAPLFQLPMGPGYSRILHKVYEDHELERGEILELLSTQDPGEMQALLRAADLVRRECVGDRVDIRGAIEFSNYCRKNCLYCGIRRDNRQVNRYRMTEEEILEVAGEIHALGLRTVILQSGEDPYYTTERMLSIIRGIKERYGLRITLSLGMRRPEEYRLFREAGANNYLLKVEAADPRLFASLHPDDAWGERVEHHRYLKEAGLLLGSGNMVGLPGQTLEGLVEDIRFVVEKGVHMVGIGPFLPAAGTPLQDSPPGALELTLKVLALVRIVGQNIFLPSTTALATLHPEGLRLGLEAGANTIMLIMTPPRLRKKYQLYSGKNMVDLTQAVAAVKAAGRQLPVYLG